MRKTLSEKIMNILKIKTQAGGLEISDTMLRFVYFDGALWQLVSQRMPPGAMEKGLIKDKELLLASLSAFHEQIAMHHSRLGRKNKAKRINVISTLSSLNIYAQTFNLPKIEGQSLHEAVQLNLQMLSPAEFSDVYAGWQVVGDDQAGHIEILSAFVNRSSIDQIAELLDKAGFSVIAFEPRSLSLARLAKERGVGFDLTQPALILHIDDNGIDFLVVRHGELYFNYFTPWYDLGKSSREISKTELASAVNRNLNQVLNFTTQHFQDSVKEIFVSAANMPDEVLSVMKDTFKLTVKELKLETDKPIATEWFIVLGSGLRALASRSEKREIAFVGLAARAKLYQDQTIVFLDFWRFLIPGALTILLAAFIAADLFARNIAARESSFTPSTSHEDLATYQALKLRASQFNESVVMIQSIQQSIIPRSDLIERINSLAASHSISVESFSFDAKNFSVNLSGRAGSAQGVLDFKNALVAESDFREVNLPIERVERDFSFSVSFFVTPSNTP